MQYFEGRSGERPLRSFIDALCQTNIGSILAVNIFDDLKASPAHVDVALAREIFQLAQDCKSSTPHEAYDAVIDAVIEKKPEFFFRRMPRPEVADRTLLTILTTARVCDEGIEGLVTSESLESNGLLGLRTGLNETAAPTDHYERLAALIETGEGLRPGAAFGKQFNIFWATFYDDAWEALMAECEREGRCLASRKRDYLGLGRIPKKSPLLEFRFKLPDSDAEACAPTFLEALNNTRWMSRARRDHSAVGVAADLRKLREAIDDFDGAPEVIIPCLPVSKSLQNCSFGRIVDEDADCTDQQFLKAILRGRTISDIVGGLADQLS